MFRGLCIGAVLLINSIVQAGEMRTWIDRTGKHKIKAELVSYEKGTVTLKTAEGKLITLVVFKLSKTDREFVYKFHNPDYGKRKSRESASDDPKGAGIPDGDDAAAEDDSTEIDEKGKSKTEGSDRATKSKKDRTTRRPRRGNDRDRVAGDQESPSSSQIIDSVSEPGQQKVEVKARAQGGGALGEEEAASLLFVLTFTGDLAEHAVAYGHLKIERFVDQNGVDLIPLFQFLPEDPQTTFVPFASIVAVAADNDFSNGLTAEASNQQQDRSSAKEITWFVRPHADTASIAQFKGTMKLKTGGDRRRIRLANAGTETGIVSPSGETVNAFTMELKHPTPNSLELLLTGDVSAIVKVTVLDVGGMTVDTVGSSAVTSGELTTVSWTFANEVPADTQVVLDLATQLQEVEVPFDINEVALDDAR